ncbi:MFS transporter [Taylorella equigenitalis]|uniref:Transport protein n=2 Tax=Taylorella equigenitalis TaxID=29575 RepID=A0A654KG73_TAYEM|nr:MFS transporter [Taylorella equigenitalis]ADU91448.1 Putative transport protein [Taylorella equigenitalis MCE9]AFN36534.1 putative MFS family transporter [Taylorella equigenitalis ATCC 35865]ASY31100.1 MFS transporter [Taylorella equigenitalis]ASY38402.1 MFS transporter [Taylorella equigenitalis]ASY39934.1 MFS transporter [Taylorella equigenitalis]
MAKDSKVSFTSLEKKASSSLAFLFAIRMLGLFLLTPVFSAAAVELHGGDQKSLVGLAIGMYGITQAIMQLPFGFLSDRFGRKPVIIIGTILFILGGIVCALAESVHLVMIGRAIQGAGAVSAAITAWVADATREEVRTRAMAMVGSSIGLSFAMSLVLGPLLVDWLGLSGLFWVISAMGVVCLGIATFVTPVVKISTKSMSDASIKSVFFSPELLRLNFGMFVLHASLMALFVLLPDMFGRMGIQVGKLWMVYLPVILVAIMGMIPAIIKIERGYKHREGLIFSVLTLMIVAGLWLIDTHTMWWSVVLLIGFFTVFNLVEALIPSMVSRVTPVEHKGLAMGLYNMAQAIGVAFGSFLGGFILQYNSERLLFLALVLLYGAWLLVANSSKFTSSKPT